MAAYTKCTNGVDPLVKAINAGTDSYKIALSNADPTAKTSFTPGTDDLTTGNGYTAGGNAASVTSAITTAGTFKLILGSPATWTASGGNIGPFQYAILWDTTQSAPLGFWNYGSAITLNGTNGDTFQVTLDGTNGVFTVA
jgi:hypothetical protein